MIETVIDYGFIQSVVDRVNLYKRGDNWHMNFTVDGVQHRMSLRTKDKSKALLRIPTYVSRRLSLSATRSTTKYQNPIQVDQWNEVVKTASKNKQSWLGYMHQRILDRSRRRAINCDITYSDLQDIAYDSMGLCAVSRIPFNWDKNDARIPPFAPSPDRISPALGYTKGNVRLVCNSVNQAMGEWGEIVLHKIVDSMSKQI